MVKPLASRLAHDAKSSKAAEPLLPFNRDRVDPRPARAALAPVEDLLDVNLLPLKKRLDGSVGAIHHPPIHPVGSRDIPHRGPEQHSLDDATDHDPECYSSYPASPKRVISRSRLSPAVRRRLQPQRCEVRF